MLVQPNTFCIENNLLDLSTVRSAIMESNNGVLSTNGQAPLHRSLSHGRYYFTDSTFSSYFFREL